jgi:hypothetical protein
MATVYGIAERGPSWSGALVEERESDGEVTLETVERERGRLR